MKDFRPRNKINIKIVLAFTIASFLATACGPSQSPTVYVQPQQQSPTVATVATLDGQQVYSNGHPVLSMANQLYIKVVHQSFI